MKWTVNVNPFRACICCVVFLAGAPLLCGQSRSTPNTLRLDKDSVSQPAKISDVNWLTGHWRGQGLGGDADEMWSAPSAGTMVGTFRLIQNDKLAFSEYFVIMEENGSLVLRLKHFDPLFNGWEKKDKFVEFKLIRVDGKTAFFDGLTYRLDADGKLHAVVAMKKQDGTFNEGKFVYEKREPGTKTETSEDSDERDDTLPPIELPMDPTTVVFEYELVGGFGIRPPPGFVPTPRIRIFADGRVLCGTSNPVVANVEYQLGEEELMKFLRFVVNENAFYDITTEGTKRQMEQSDVVLRLADAPTSRIAVELVRGKHEVSCYALHDNRKPISRNRDLQRLDAIHQRSEKLRDRAYLGDDRQAARLLAQLNKQFKRDHPGVGQFELGDLVNADAYADGKLTASFDASLQTNKVASRLNSWEGSTNRPTKPISVSAKFKLVR